MADKPLITVWGATGAQGGSVAEALASSGRYRVRGITRNANSDKAKELSGKGIEMVQADVGKKEDLLKVLEGAYGAYIVTDFWTLLEKEFDYGKLAVESAKAAGVKHVVWSSLPNTLAQSDGKINVPHFVSKAKVEAVVVEQGFEYYTFSMCALYFQNFSDPKLHFTAPGEGDEVLFTLPMQPGDYITAGDVTDTGPAVLTIFDNPKEWHGKHVALAGTHATFEEYAKVFEQVKQRKAKVVTIQPANEELGAMFKWFSDNTYFGTYDISSGRKCYPKLKTWEEWLRSTPWTGPTAN